MMDEFACLNLNITTPLEQQDELLPVAVFIHGCDYYPQPLQYYDSHSIYMHVLTGARLEEQIVSAPVVPLD